MCGIIGILGQQQENIAPHLFDSLKRLEYRGYDSAGIATLVNGHIERRRAQGKLSELETVLNKDPLPGTIGIGHTRWATHGVPSEENAHPHATDMVAVVHNGIIENFQELRAKLQKTGAKFASETDTEVIAHLLTHHLKSGDDPIAATQKTLDELEGAFALAILFAGHHDLMIGARRGSPLVIGQAGDDMQLGSDAIALAGLAKEICYLEEGDWAVLRPGQAEIYNAQHQRVNRAFLPMQIANSMIGKGNYRHFMLKEIHEQPAVIGDSLHVYFNPTARQMHFAPQPFTWADLDYITLIACGTSFYAGMVARYWLETIAKIHVNLDLASEFRYRVQSLPQNNLSIFISQSGETADTLAALRHIQPMGGHSLALVNVETSSLAREADTKLRTKAGPEIGVASTKAFTTQLAVLASLTLALAREKKMLDPADEKSLTQNLVEVPAKIAQILQKEAVIESLAHKIVDAKTVLYLGRGLMYPIALEGALKLKEISYIHAEGYAAGEMKHGPIALIDEHVPVIVLAPSNHLFEKTFSNIQEVLARGGRIIAITDKKGAAAMKDLPIEIITVPESDEFTTPLLYAVPVQLLAYHVAVLKGTDVDQPRNLAKSVTVE